MILHRRDFLLAAGATLAVAACRADDTASGSTTTGPTAAPVTAASPTTASRAAGTTVSTASAASAEEAADTPSSSAVGADGAELAPFAAADFEALGTCLLLPEVTTGPFPLDEQFDRRDITEGYPGHPVRLGIRVVDQSCAPVPGAIVEIWHSDASGDYSAFTDGGGDKDEAEGTTFLRGSQTADADGIVEFHTIYPGWYPGRAVHIHVRVHVGGAARLASQIFFDDAYTAAVLATGAYADHGPPDTTNASDRIAGDTATNGTRLHLAAGETHAGTGTVALLNLGVAT